MFPVYVVNKYNLVPDSSGQFRPVQGSSGQFMTVQDSSGQFWAVQGNLGNFCGNVNNIITTVLIRKKWNRKRRRYCNT